MFYSVYVLGKKGPLARVWLAAHWDKKITKAQILETNIVESVDSILQPRVKLSLRTSSHLLVGVVRIYSRKALYLLQDCQDAAFKIKSAFRPGVVDLPDGKTEAAIAAITLPNFDFDTIIDEPPLQIEPVQTNANIKNITLSDDVVSMHTDDDFAFLGSQSQAWSELSSVNVSNSRIDHSSKNVADSDGWLEQFDRPITDDGFGGSCDQDLDDLFTVKMPTSKQPEYNKNPIENGHGLDSLMSNGNDHVGGDHNGAGNIDLPFGDGRTSRSSNHSDSNSFGPGSPAMSTGAPSTPGSAHAEDDYGVFGGHDGPSNSISFGDPEQARDDSIFDQNFTGNQSSLNEANMESMVLDPIEDGGAGIERRKKRRKKLGIIIDEVKTLSGEEMKSQLSDTTDIIAELDLAPPSKKLMHLKRTAGIEKLFSNPIIPIPSKTIIVYYTRNLHTCKVDVDSEQNLSHRDWGNEIGYQDDGYEYDNIGYDNQNKEGYGNEHDQASFGYQQANSPLHEIQPQKALTHNDSHQLKKGRKKRQLDDSIEDENEKSVDRESSKRPRRSAAEYTNNENEQQSLERDGSYSLHHPLDSFSYQKPPENDYDDGAHDDYDNPTSVAPPDEPQEERFQDETEEAFEERKRKNQSLVLLKFMSSTLCERPIVFSSLVTNNKRKQVAQKFYSLLVLKKQRAIELDQVRSSEEEYGDLIIRTGEKFHAVISGQ